jgi:hypothetical protein
MVEEVSFAPLSKETAARVSETLQLLLQQVSALLAFAEQTESAEVAALVRSAVAEVMVVALSRFGRPLLGAWDVVLPHHLRVHLETTGAQQPLGLTAEEEIATDEHEAISAPRPRS